MNHKKITEKIFYLSHGPLQSSLCLAAYIFPKLNNMNHVHFVGIKELSCILLQ